MNINPHVFRKYDIRGVAFIDLTEEFSYNLGKSITSCFLDKKGQGTYTFAVGYDVRTSSSALKSSMIKGFLDSGINIIDLGYCPTPLVYYSLFTQSVDGGVMITGSHNPKEDNGYKICYGQDTIYGEDIEFIKKRMEEDNYVSASIKSGSYKTFDIVSEYVNFMTKRFDYMKEMKELTVVVDAGNGAASLCAPQLYSQLGCQVFPLYCEPDGTFPNHHPDPTIVNNLKDIIEEVKKNNAQVGLAFDGDGDRLGVIDNTGKIIWGDELMVLFSRSILKESPHSTFVSEVKCSQVMYDDIEKQGGKAIMWKTGHSLIKKKMKEENAVLAGEMSGHIFFAHRYFGYDDALYAGVRLIEILKKEEKTLQDLLTDLPPTFKTPEIRFDCPDDKKFDIVQKMTDLYRKRATDPASGIKKIIDIDGIRVVFDKGWALVRASNTQPVLVLRFEAESEEVLEVLKKQFENELAEIIKT
jgi:phosphomannomutase/phosphoglucomutase